MHKWIIAFLVGGIIVACGNSNGADTNNASVISTNEAPPPDGQKIYKQYCVTCHGLYGDMGASGAHDLTASTLSVEERIAVITNGRGAMTPFQTLLKPDQIEAVATYTRELRREEESE